jgi:probable phosphoglycerate mutase
MTTIVFIRHGETDWNVQQRFQGQIDVPLNARGQAQAAQLAARLATAPAAALLSSDLQRARQTAAPLAAAWGLAEGDVATLPGLREQGFGVLEGLDAPTIRSRHPELWARWLDFDPDFAPPGGESTRRFHARVLDAVRALAAGHPAARADAGLVVVTHGGVLDMLWRSAHGLPLHGPRRCEIPNTGLNRLRWRDGTLEVQAWADAAHLDEPPPA